MIDISRRKYMQYMALLGLGVATGGLIPIRATLKERKKAYYASQKGAARGFGYYGFSETW